MKKLIGCLYAVVAWGLMGSVSLGLTIDLEKTTPQVKHQNKVALESKKKLVGPAVLDARSAFDYSMSHLLLASNIRWQDYAQTEEPHRGSLDPDFDLLARKLRLFGVTPERPVIIFGKGKSGDGSEGRIAWMLAFLGVKNIELKNFDKDKSPKTTSALETRQSAPIWLPQVVSELRAEKRDIENLHDGAIVDVREEDEFSKNHLPQAINISSKLFFNDNDELMGPDNIVRILKEHHIDTQKTLIFISNQGVRSGFVTFATWTAHLHGRNYDGGMNEIRPNASK